MQDRVCNTTGVLERDPVGLGTQLREAPVWGIDCYTRRMVELSLEDRLPAGQYSVALVTTFIEHHLLPSINALAVDRAHNMIAAAASIIEVLSTSYPIFP